MNKRLLFILACLFNIPIIWAADYYVRPAGSSTAPSSPYAAWETAATNIQSALDEAMANLPATVWVTNGVYTLVRQIEITNSVALRSVNGAAGTVVQAAWPDHTTRCFYVVSGMIDGFTVRDGHYMASNDYSGGGGLYLASGAMLRNCLVADNVCSNTGLLSGGGGVYATNAAITNCHFIGNVSIGARLPSGALVGGGGGVFIAVGTIVGSIVASNRCDGVWAYGGGIYSAQSRTDDCVIDNNYAAGGGGGLFMADSMCRVGRCIVTANSGGWAGGAHVGAAGKGGGILADSIISNNVGRGQNRNAGGGVTALGNSEIINCRIVNNACSVSGKGLYFKGGAVVSNCFIAANSYEH